MCNPFFSVIIPTYNRQSYLKKTLETVCAQTDKRFECLVIDDGSTDDTASMVRAWEDDRIHYLYQDNQGPAAARNHGLAQAQGTWIAFLDSDDWWEPSKLARFAEEINHKPRVQIFHSEEVWFKDGKRHNPKIKHQKPSGFVYFKALPLCCISISTAVIHKDVFKRVGGFDETLPACEDYDFWLRAAHQYEVCLIDEYLTLKDGGRPDQLSFSMPALDQYRIKSLVKMLDSGSLSGEEYAQTYAQLKKKCRIFANGAAKRGKSQEAQSYLELIGKWAP